MKKWTPNYQKILEKVAAAHADDDFVPTIKDLADKCGTTVETLNQLRKSGLVLPVKTKNGYNFAEFKRSFDAFASRRRDGEAGSLKDKKIEKEIERLTVAIKIDNERLKQAELETKAQQGKLVDYDHHCRVMDDIRELYCNGLDQIVESVSTKLRNPKVHESLRHACDDLRRRLAAGA